MNRLFVALLFVQLAAISVSRFNHRITRVLCSTSGKSILKNISCNFRTFKRNGYFNIRATMTRLVPNAKASYLNSRKKSDGYQKVLGVKDVEICKILNNAASKNSLVQFAKIFVDYIKSISNGNFINACNMTGDIYGYNLTMANMSSFELFPAGEYMGTMIVYDDLDSNIFNITLQFRLIKY